MNVYMATHIRQTIKRDILGHEHWEDDKASNHTFFIFADNDKEANDYCEMALKKRNDYSNSNERFVMGTEHVNRKRFRLMLQSMQKKLNSTNSFSMSSRNSGRN